MSQPWTHDLVSARFRSTWDTLRRMPRVRGPDGARSTWPETVQDAITAYGYTEVEVRLPAPRPRAIDEAEEVFGWFKHFDGKQEADIVWMAHGRRLKFKTIARIMSLHRHTVRAKVFSGMSRVVCALNSECGKQNN